jgi:hypothetical protein
VKTRVEVKTSVVKTTMAGTVLSAFLIVAGILGASYFRSFSVLVRFDMERGRPQYVV